MIKYFQKLKSFIPLQDCNLLEDGVNAIKKMDKSINSSNIRFTLKLDTENKLWFFDSPPTNCYFGLKKRYGRINRYRAQPIDAINVIFQLFRESKLEDYNWNCTDCGEVNTDEKVVFYSETIGFDYRVECAKCRTYHYNKMKKNILVTSMIRPQKNRWK